MKRILAQQVVVREGGAHAFCYWEDGALSGSLSFSGKNEEEAKRGLAKIMRDASLPPHSFSTFYELKRKPFSRSSS